MDMETWIRPDGRYYQFWLDRDLFGPVVIVLYGGNHHSCQRLLAVESAAEGERVMAQLSARRQARGYVKTMTQ